MTRTINLIFKNKFMRTACLCSGLLASFAPQAALVNLATAPLANSTTSLVLPNLMYVLDNSGSMGNNYMPDYVNDSEKCKDPGSSTGAFRASCGHGDPAFMTKDFNSIYYNPAITYLPGLNADGTAKTSMTSANTSAWTVVPTDAFNIQNSDQLGNNVTSISLIPNGTNTIGYPDKVWCNTTAATTADLTDPSVCKQNSQYIFPNNTGTQATSYNQPYWLLTNPYYYTDSPSYCTDKTLTSCQAAADATHTVPGILLWCNSAAAAVTTTPSATNCKPKFSDSTYKYARWLAITTDTVDATIKFKADTNTPAASPVPLQVTNIKVDTTTITNAAFSITDTTNVTQRNTLASNLANNINSYVSTPDYTATATGDVLTISPVAVGASNSTIFVTTTQHVTTAVTPLVNAVGSITFSTVGKNKTLNSLSVGSVNLFCGSVTSSGSNSASTRLNDLASQVAVMINSCTSSPQDYTATCAAGTLPNCTSGKVNITAATAGSAGNGTLTGNPVSDTNITYTVSNLAGGTGTPSKTYAIPSTKTNFLGGTPVVTTFDRVDIEPGTPTYPKASSRTDCGAGATCTYDQEMTNFANWYSYYRSRMQMMKSAASRAFKNIDTRYRVGFITITSQSSNYLPIATFDATQKTNWYAKLFATDPNNSTPLRSALSIVGRIYAGKHPVSGFSSDDPVQYSCQQNFALLTTDGYWNSDSTSDVKNILGTGTVGNKDGSGTDRPMYEGPTATSETLADVAKYYYDTDLRTSALGNCTSTAGEILCTNVVNDPYNNVFTSSTDNNVQQHMTTYTLGLGVDGTLNYTSDYKTATSGDFYDLSTGSNSINWPVPVQNEQTAVDDLWHAAVNGRGTYFSAKDPNQLSISLTGALSSITSKIGAGAAAATSTLNPVAGDNFAYVASYATVKWTGNLEARNININTGAVSPDATWCAESISATACPAGTSDFIDTSVTPSVSYCVRSGATVATCNAPDIFDASTNSCNELKVTACTGTMTSGVPGVPTAGSTYVVSPNTDTRTIYMNVSGALQPFTYANLSATQKTNFDATWLAANLSQWSSLTSTQQALVPGANLVNFLRGQTGYEERASNLVGTVDNRLYRLREAVLGDPLESTPAFNGVPKATYADPGYGSAAVLGTFAYQQASRDGTIYIGTNDGMLHAFGADDGVERWAYVPSMVIPNMWRLADKNYANLHTNYANGDAIINDVCTANCTLITATWKTILVAGLNGGGKGYYALDITNPTTPSLLWEFNTTSDSDLGYTFGNPIITKKADGTWVVVITSGYNNTGLGYLYVLNANTGAIITKYSTGAGDATTPSGLAKISAFVTDSLKNNTALNIYGGDLLGNLWRFDINAASSSTNPFKLAKLQVGTGGSAVLQPITVKPELSAVDGKRIVFVGTGKYLESADLSNPAQQTLYAITDDNEVTTFDNPRNSTNMVQQSLTTTGATRSITNNPVDYTSKRGWFIDLPDSGERQNVPSQLVFGTLLVPTIVPSNTVCSPGGYGWLNFVNFRTGAVIGQTVVSAKTNAPIVGINVLYVNGQPKVSLVTSDNPTPEFPPVQPEFTGGSLSGFQEHRVIWRELLDQQQ